MPKITQFAANGCGARNVGFHLDGIHVLLHSPDEESNERVWDLAGELSTIREVLKRTAEERDMARAMLADIKRPSKLMAPTVVRYRAGDGRLYLMNRQDGWSSSCYWYEDWTELLRHWDLRVIGPGSDEHGPYWEVR